MWGREEIKIEHESKILYLLLKATLEQLLLLAVEDWGAAAVKLRRDHFFKQQVLFPLPANDFDSVTGPDPDCMDWV